MDVFLVLAISLHQHLIPAVRSRWNVQGPANTSDRITSIYASDGMTDVIWSFPQLRS